MAPAIRLSKTLRRNAAGQRRAGGTLLKTMNAKTNKSAALTPARRMGNFLTYLRRDAGFIKQSAFAQKLRVSRFYLSNIEAGRTPLKLKAAWDACRELDVHPDFLISCGKNNRAPFPVLEPAAQARADALISVSRNTDFVDAWPAVRDVLFPPSPAAPAPDAELESYIDKIAARVEHLKQQPDAKAKLARVIAALKA